jgi:hypothetical protein
VLKQADKSSLQPLTVIGAARIGVGATWRRVMVSLAVGAAVSRWSRHDYDDLVFLGGASLLPK